LQSSVEKKKLMCALYLRNANLWRKISRQSMGRGESDVL